MFKTNKSLFLKKDLTTINIFKLYSLKIHAQKTIFYLIPETETKNILISIINFLII